jgi:drug/metabolite transporter (DMT)-like permease
MLVPISASAFTRIKGSQRSIALRVLLATALGTNLGIALQQVVFQQLPVGPGVTLMSTAPVMALVVARFEGEALQWRGVMAALLAVSGVALTSLWS